MPLTSNKRILFEKLNPNLGFFYSINKTLAIAKTKYQTIELVDTDEFGTVLLLDHVTQVVEKNDFQYHEPMVHAAMIAHPNPQDVLIVGGGDGGILREVLRYKSVCRAVIAELDGEVIKFSRQHLSRINRGAFDDPRVELRITDGRKYVKNNPGQFDVVIMDMTDPFGPSTMLYTKEFFTYVKKSFKNRFGIFTMHSSSPITRPVAFASIIKTLKSVFRNVATFYAHIQMYGTLWSISVCSDAVNVSEYTAGQVDARLRKNGILRPKFYTGAMHRAMLAEHPYITDIRKNEGKIITDRHPHFPDHFDQ